MNANKSLVSSLYLLSWIGIGFMCSTDCFPEEYQASLNEELSCRGSSSSIRIEELENVITELRIRIDILRDNYTSGRHVTPSRTSLSREQRDLPKSLKRDKDGGLKVYYIKLTSMKVMEDYLKQQLPVNFATDIQRIKVKLMILMCNNHFNKKVCAHQQTADKWRSGELPAYHQYAIYVLDRLNLYLNKILLLPLWRKDRTHAGK